jgi:hypothetical protein
MYNLLRQKTSQFTKWAVGLMLLIASQQASAQLRDQLNLPDHDNKKYYLGIGIIYNNSRFQVAQHSSFLSSDSVMVVEPENAGGFGLAGMHTLRLSPRFEIRAVFPQLLFSYKNLTYHIRYPDPNKQEQPVTTKKVESSFLGLPVHLKFRSDRIGNFRVYMFGGGKVEYDLASNSTARKADDLVKLRKYDFGVEAGIGFNFYFPVFILSPELKISNGIFNTHSRDAGLKYSSSIDQLNSRMILFSLIFEG